LLVAGDYFLFAAARPGPQPVGGQLAEHLQGTAAEPLLAFELSFGQRSNGWTISHSTLPGRAGQRLHQQPEDGAAVLPTALIAQLGVYPAPGGWQVAANPTLPAALPIPDVEVSL
jgi:hypothetical protein